MWLWLFTPAGKRVVLATAALAALAAGFLALRSHYIALGKQEDAAAALESSAKQLGIQQKEFQSRYAALEAQRSIDAARSQALLISTNKLAAQIAAMESERVRDLATVESLPEPSLVPDLRRMLNVEPASLSANLLPTELRAADSIVTEFPAVTAENRDLTASNQALTSRVASLAGEVNSVTQERNMALDWGDDIFTQYRNCYNAFPRHRSILANICHVASLGLACKPKKLTLEPPSLITRQRPLQSAAPTDAKKQPAGN
jgi:hypothetical protein